MSKLNQECNDNAFALWEEKYQEKEIIKRCKKLAKSCALTKSKDVSTLCELAYWFYIYDYQDEVLNIYNLVNIEIPQRVNYNIWTWILSIYGLQAYIYELNGETTEKDKIIEKINKIYSVPRRDGQTEQEAYELHIRIANRQTYEEICNKNKIESCIAENDKKLELSYRFTALFSMISDGVTGDYPALESNKDKLIADISDYIDILKCNI
ncbi:hypothetical protein JFL47_11635 [Haemophilus haemoglobinophilus]|nr:hypothetical protein [Canicola haemoglobinophilus]MBN6711866.1 hypothetical protein [Canicola haemoglobinophilus]